MAVCAHATRVCVGAIRGVVVVCVLCGLFTRLCIMCMHVHFLYSYTFFWTLDVNNATDTAVCSPHISLLRSFNKTARAMQIPG